MPKRSALFYLARASTALYLSVCTLALPKVANAGQLTVLHSFTGKADGAEPNGSLKIGASGDLFGKTIAGAAECPNGEPHLGCGTIFRIRPDGTFSTLTHFAGVRAPAAGPSTLAGQNGVLYGSGYNAHASYNAHKPSAIFSMAEDGSDFTLLHYFETYGHNQIGKLRIGGAGLIYGVASRGGTLNEGELFTLSSNGTFNVKHSFNFKTDGYEPNALVTAPDGTLYGSTVMGPRSSHCRLSRHDRGCGIIYSFNPATNSFMKLYEFRAGPDGAFPILGGMDDAGNLYGITYQGGAGNSGTLFEMQKTGSGFAYHLLWSFDGGVGGASPQSPPSVRGDGTLVGTTTYGPYPGGDDGVLYLFRNGTFTPLLDFSLNVSGAFPVTTPIMDEKGVIYGTTSIGGPGPAPCTTEKGRTITSVGCGVVYRYTP